MNFQEIIIVSFAFLGAVKVSDIIYWIYTRIKNRERSKEVDIEELQATVKTLDRRSVMQAQAFNERWINVEETARKQKHYLDNVLRAVGDKGAIQQRIKALEAWRERHQGASLIQVQNNMKLLDRLINIETFIKDFSAEDLKRMQHDNEQVESLLKRIARLEEMQKNK